MTRSPAAAVREQAAQLCSQRAYALCEMDFGAWDHTWRAFSGSAMDIAFDVFAGTSPRLLPCERWALACSMLRNGEVR